MARVTTVALALATALAIAGCGSSDSKSTTSNQVGGNNSGSLGPPTILTLVYDSGKGRAVQARLTCTADGEASGSGYLNSQSAAKQACEGADSASKLLIDGPDTTKACTQVYGGPQTLDVKGRVDFKTVEQTFKRTNGCQIADWKQLGPLLPPGAPS